MGLLTCGISFAGKSTLGHVIPTRFGYEQVDVDDTKFALFGAVIRDDELSRAEWNYIYDQTDRLIHEYLNAGKSVVDGSGNFRRSERQTVRDLADPVRDETATIFVDTPESVARQRLLANRERQARLDVTDDDFEHILSVWEPPAPEENALILRYGEDMDAWIDAHAALLRSKDDGPISRPIRHRGRAHSAACRGWR
jgi:predicted kinase